MDDTQPPKAATPDRTLLAVLIAVGLLVVIALVVVVVRNATPEMLDSSTPAGVVQRYAQAVIDDDGVAAGAYLVASPDDCSYFDRADRDLRLSLRSTEISGDRATVRVAVTTSYGDGPFSSSESTSDDTFTLVKSQDGWMIEETPYEFISCPNGATN